MIDWDALAQEYYSLANDARKNGNYDLANYWRKAGDAAKDAARHTKQEQQNEQPQPIPQS